MNIDLINSLTMKDVAAAKQKRGALHTIDYVLSMVDGKVRTLEAAKAYLLKEAAKMAAKASK
jgi:hypothetical protein